MQSAPLIDKNFLRKDMLARRRAQDPVYMAQAAKSLAEHLAAIIDDTPPCTIAGYAAIRKEIDVFPAMQMLAARGHTLCLPDVEHKQTPLVFHRWQPGDAMVTGSYGISVPEKGYRLTPDIVLVPLVAFDARGYRLGYGAGYYDQTICQLRGGDKPARIIGVAYSTQQIDEIPAEPHDETLDMVVTEKGRIDFSKGVL